MKTWTLILVGMLLVAAGSAARRERHKAINAGKAEMNYLRCLNSGTDAIVESALAGVVALKMALPEHDFARLEKRAGELAVNGRTASIRFKAYLTNAVLENPGLFGRYVDMRPDNPEELFYFIASRLHMSLLGYSHE